MVVYYFLKFLEDAIKLLSIFNNKQTTHLPHKLWNISIRRNMDNFNFLKHLPKPT
nr:MAG TPA: hypothetical protein [Bacteriophage sp.]